MVHIRGSVTKVAEPLFCCAGSAQRRLYVRSKSKSSLHPQAYGFIIGIVFITSVSILLILVIKRIYKHINNECQAKKLKESQEKYLKDLDYEKTSLIISFLREPTHTISLPMQDGRVIELQYYNVITPAGSTHLVSMPNPQITYFLQPWVKARINENSELRAKFIV